jgi:hypothetical protein
LRIILTNLRTDDGFSFRFPELGIEVIKMKQLFFPALVATMAFAQTDNRVLLVVDVDNAVTYRSDVTDYARRGADGVLTTAQASRAFTDGINIGDIVAVNGKPAHGLWTSRSYAMGFSPTPAVGFGIADAALGGTSDCKWAFYDADGRYIGAILDGGYAPHAVTGGLGAFYGIRGQMGGTLPEPLADARPLRTASISEDPGKRRILGGGKTRIPFYLIPAERPEVQIAYHEDFSAVTATSPARPGEVLVIRATGLGPLTPGLDPSGVKPFPNPPVEVNSPVEATIGGVAAPVLNKVGWPGQINVYRVDIRVPAGIPSGQAGIQLTAAWIPGPVLALPIQ